MKKVAFVILFTIVIIGSLLFLQAIPLPAHGTENVVYSEGFESSDGSYTHTGTEDQWEWGTPAYASGPSSAHSGLKCWATNLDGDVSSGNEYLTSPQVTLPSIGADQLLRVQFYAWIAVDEMYDRGEFQVSSDGIAYVTVAELFHTMQGQWSAYDFDISNYAGGPIYLRFRVYADYSNAFSQSTFNMAGLYIDDVKITRYDAPATKTTLTLEAWEDQGAYASCPWVFSWTGSEFVQDNDVYSTARGVAKEFADYYKLSALPVPVNDKYLLDLREVTQEISYTDLVKLLAVDHSSATEVAPDEDGNIWTYANPVSPASAIDGKGNNVLVQLADEDDTGFEAYDGDVVTLDFNNIDVSSGATLVLRVAGFKDDGDPGTPTGNRPYVFVQTQDASQNWITRHYFYPRDDWATAAFDLTPYLMDSKLVRLSVTSCHTGKYQLIDFVGLDNSAQADKVVHVLSPVSAVHSINGDVLPEIADSDNGYAIMTSGEKISLSFEVPEMQNEVRDFVLLTEGYYVPSGTFFIYTWDGSSWVERDGWSVEGSSDQTHDFDMSLFLPDPEGDFKVRIWQDYWYEPAGIDFVGLSHGGTVGTMVSAFDLRKNTDVTSELESSDNIKDDWTTYSDYPYNRDRNRWVEVSFSVEGAVNTPPTTNPVTVTDLTSTTPTISWTYGDVDGDAQAEYEVEVWTGTGGVGANMWDPAPGTGTATSIVYAGTPLTVGETYYARVKAFDGTDWGQWSETPFVVNIVTVVSLESCDATGFVKNSFTAAENVYVKGTGYGESMTYDMYVVCDVDWSDGMTIPTRITGTTTSVASDASGEIDTTMAWSGPLTVGEYDIVIDVNGNGKYDADIDAVDDNEIATAGFLVVPLQQVIPEVPLGTLVASTSMAIALMAYFIPKFTRKQKNKL